MPSQMINIHKIELSHKNGLYCVDRSLVDFSKSYEPKGSPSTASESLPTKSKAASDSHSKTLTHTSERTSK